MNRLPRHVFLAACCLLLLSGLHAQDKLPVKFGKISPGDFNVAPSGGDSAASALTVADYGYSWFEGNPKGGFTLNFKHSRRIKIIKREGFDAATIIIPLYVSGTDAERIDGLKAATYNLEGGKVVETKLEDKAVFTDRINKNWVEKKFTFPALKEGSVVEYSYTQTSPFFFNLQPWSFQGEYPCLWSEYEVDMPQFFQFVTMSHGYVPFSINTTESKTATFHLSYSQTATDRPEAENIDDEVVMHRWVMKNVRALKPEAFTTSVENYMARIEFQLARVQFPNTGGKDYMNTWVGMSEELLNSEHFGIDLDRNNGWLDDDMRTVTMGAKTDQEKAQRIYDFVRDNFKCTEHDRVETDESIKTVFRNRNGSEAEINLLLTAMLRHEKLTVDPIILSTRDHGFANEIYPLLTRFNYVICRLSIDSSQYFLDASEPWLGFGRLPERCYNGYARLLNKEKPEAISLDADQLRETENTLVILTSDEKGVLSGRLQTTPGYNEACSIRSKVRSSGQDAYVKSLQAAYTGDVSASNFEFDSLRIPDEPLQLAYDLNIAPDPAADIFYFNPMLDKGYKENPFKAADRIYPVEMPCPMDEVFTLNMDIPTGYVVDELPKQAKVLFNDNEGYFEYLIQQTDAGIQFRSRIKLNKANFKPEDYSTLRDFFGYIVKKQSEQIVFKKKKA